VRESAKEGRRIRQLYPDSGFCRFDP